MNRVLVALPLVAVLAAAAWPPTRAEPAAAPGVCEQMTATRLLQEPTLASAYAEALRTGDQGELAHVRAMISQIRSAHGCAGDVALPDSAPTPRLPPGHPPIAPGERPPTSVRFEDPGTVTI